MRRSHMTLMVKPASAACNLKCDYCFYFDAVSMRSEGCHHMMDDTVVEAIIMKSLQEAESCTYVFQGGEPTLAGLPFFKRFIDRVNAYKLPDSTVRYTFQTNALNLDRDWARFFKQHDMLVGVSFDGTPRLHDFHRMDRNGNGSGRKVINSISMLEEEGVDFNILCVVTNELAQNIRQVFSYLVNHNLRYHQYIPCMDPLAGDVSYLTPDMYSRFLRDLFDLWFSAYRKGTPVSIRLFDNLVGMIAGYPPESCDMAGICSIQYVAESNGDIYPCDFYCTDDHLLGSIAVDSFKDLDARRSAMLFIENSANRVDPCTECRWKLLCRGGCRRYRTDEGYRFCSSMKEFFPYVIERMQIVAQDSFSSVSPPSRFVF